MQILVMYHSATGNTKRLAEAVVEGVKEVEGVTCVVKSAPEVTEEDFLSADGIIAGSPVYFGTMAAELKGTFDRLVETRAKMGDKIGAAFATSGDASGGKETTMLSILQAFLIYGMVVVGDPLDATGHYGVSCVEGPDANIAARAKKLGKRVAQLAKKVRS
jgi:NAD(P)H dehydrogenase (quinone)